MSQNLTGVVWILELKVIFLWAFNSFHFQLSCNEYHYFYHWGRINWTFETISPASGVGLQTEQVIVFLHGSQTGRKGSCNAGTQARQEPEHLVSASWISTHTLQACTLGSGYDGEDLQWKQSLAVQTIKKCLLAPSQGAAHAWLCVQFSDILWTPSSASE